MKLNTAFWGELVGTFILIFGGLSAVAGAVTLGAFGDLFSVAAVWGLSLTVAIYVTGAVSGAHLNPAITLAFAFHGDFPKSRILPYLTAQCLGAFLAAACVYIIFGGFIADFESKSELTRGLARSEASAMIFGEYFPNPGGKPVGETALNGGMHARAFFAELLGTALLALIVFAYTHKDNKGAPSEKLVAPAIGAGLTALICLFAPMSMAGFNPARDFAPRLFSSLAGWDSLPFQVNGMGWLTVYIVAPIIGAQAGAWLAQKLLSPQR